ncbi:hypothetical protein ABEB22_18290 (plasmid) [Thioclava sp. 'Guangxiensis']|uniref:hypothetical protein n=1 Tax=Thioclava sp. 'Guangxiensis' TaxID=3149044 RepID=UPI0032C40711
MIATWPTELPRPERNSWQRSYQDGRRKSQGDAGPVRYRRKLSRSTQLVTLSVMLSRSEKAVFDRFFEEECLFGADRFWMPDPTSDGWPLLSSDGTPLQTGDGVPLLVARQWLCAWGDQLPTETIIGREFRMTFSLQVIR